ncbi:phosphate:Na+ symporter [Stella humosa]|uniref:Phosphate:Na+ symporter n=1 Tax=Stella humosa TaxID=94 RepID=A0A3N1KRT2_9PROT|nr:Na/Pi symporter [Stella humosa]ROP83301.1 phosphate:Na+ symporter [Stella humosa]BBK29916.1 hypothetical protein STHU_05500 [Stella humosa]
MLFEVISAILGGLGLAMYGMRQVQISLQAMAGRRLRDLLRHATHSPLRAALTGAGIGAITQSTNAAAYIVLSLVGAGFMPLRRGLLAVAWSAVGTAAIVLLATIRLELVVLYLVGITGFLQVSRLRDSPLWGPGISALFGVGTLFLGLQILRRSLGPMTEAPWFADVVAFSHGAPVVLLLLGAALALVVQSSSTVAAAVVALAATSWFSFEALAALVYGASLGSAGSSLILGWRMQGTGRQLLLFQAFAKVLGVAALLALAAVEVMLGLPSTMAMAVAAFADGPGAQTGIAFTAVQVAAALLATAAIGPLSRLCARLSPPDAGEALARPKYLYDEALAEPAGAVDLAGREQVRLAALLPSLLDAVRADAGPSQAAGPALPHGLKALGQAIDRFLNEILARRTDATAVADAVDLRSRNELLLSQIDTLVSLTATIGRLGPHRALEPLLSGMAESLHLVLELLAECLADPQADQIAMLALMTGDRGDVVEAMRQGAIRQQQDLPADTQEDLLRLTGLFERTLWIAGRIVRLAAKDRGARAAAWRTAAAE